MGEAVHADLAWTSPGPRLDLAWTYDYPLREVAPIAGMIAFYNEKLDIFVDGTRLSRPLTHFT